MSERGARRGRGPKPGKTPRPRKKAANQGKGTGRQKSGRGGGGPKPKRNPTRMPDPSDVEDAEIRFVQPYEATKPYLCPGCNRQIAPGLGHMVAIPPDAPDLRRHWHRGCWNNRHRR